MVLGMAMRSPGRLAMVAGLKSMLVPPVTARQRPAAMGTGRGRTIAFME